MISVAEINTLIDKIQSTQSEYFSKLKASLATASEMPGSTQDKMDRALVKLAATLSDELTSMEYRVELLREADKYMAATKENLETMMKSVTKN